MCPSCIPSPPSVSHLFLASRKLGEGVSALEAVLGTWYKSPNSLLSRVGEQKMIDDKINQLQELIPSVTALCGQASPHLPRGVSGIQLCDLSLALASDAPSAASNNIQA